MSNISNTKDDINEILRCLNLKSVENLFDIIPEKYRIDFNDININGPLSEQDIERLLKILADSNMNTSNSLNFLGGGSYDHYVPKVVDTLSSRSEFYTAYTPYQPEVSQGTLQYLYEFQSMICELSGMEVSNASLYDCASAVAEACNVAISTTRKNKILLSSMIHPNYIEVVKTYFSERDIIIDFIDSIDGLTNTDINNLDEYSCIVIQSPNYYGLIEDVEKFASLKNNSLLICVSDPISMSILKSPGENGADIYVGEGQSLGNYISYGGPYIGLFATKMKYARKIPGRIIGKTEDADGKEGYVMTLQTREQHIRREKATSNICTNQGLLVLRSSIFLSLLGKTGISGLAKICYKNSQYAASEIIKLEKYKLFSKSSAFLKEFVVKTDLSAKEIQSRGIKQNILIDLPLNDKTDSLLMFAFTEKKNKKDIDSLIDFLADCQ